MSIELLRQIETARRAVAEARAHSLDHATIKAATYPVTPEEQTEADGICERIRLDCLEALKERAYNKVSGASILVLTYAFLGLPGIVARRKLGLSIEEFSYGRGIEANLPIDYGGPVRATVWSGGRRLSEAKTKVAVFLAERSDFLLLRPGHGEIFYQVLIGRGGSYTERIRRANMEDARNYQGLVSTIFKLKLAA